MSGFKCASFEKKIESILFDFGNWIGFTFQIA